MHLLHLKMQFNFPLCQNNGGPFFCRAVEFEGYVIPQNAHVIPLLHAVHMDPEAWEAPEELRPERFLTADGSAVQKPDNFMPFGTGQRMCLGDQLAEKELFLFFTTLLHCFDLQSPKDTPLPSLRGVAGVTVTPQDFEVICVPRNLSALQNSMSSEDFKDSTNLWSSAVSHQSRTYG